MAARTSHTSSIISAAGFTTTGDLAVSGTYPTVDLSAFTGNVSAAGNASVSTDATATTLAVGGGTTITKMLKGTVSVTVGTNAAAAETDIDVSVAAATVGDIVRVTPTNAAMETGLGIIAAWVSAAGHITIRVSNMNAVAALNGSTQSWAYLLIRS